MTKGEPLDEYKIASDNLRWYSNIRFAQLTLFFAISALIANIVFEKSSLLPVYAVLIKLAGISSCGLFFHMEMRADNYWSHFMNRAVELEKKLGYEQYSKRPIRKIRTTHAIRAFISMIAIFWLTTLFI